MDKKPTNDEAEFLFNVDLMISGRNNAVALQKLLEILNNYEELADFRVVSGIKLGQKIEKSLKDTSKQQVPIDISSISESKKSITAQTASLVKKLEKHKQEAKSAAILHEKIENDMNSWLALYIKDNTLVRLTINNRGDRFSIPCRILNFDNENQTISVYHVDEKQVYTFKLNEIDDFQHT